MGDGDRPPEKGGWSHLRWTTPLSRFSPPPGLRKSERAWGFCTSAPHSGGVTALPVRTSWTSGILGPFLRWGTKCGRLPPADSGLLEDQARSHQRSGAAHTTMLQAAEPAVSGRGSDEELRGLFGAVCMYRLVYHGDSPTWAREPRTPSRPYGIIYAAAASTRRHVDDVLPWRRNGGMNTDAGHDVRPWMVSWNLPTSQAKRHFRLLALTVRRLRPRADVRDLVKCSCRLPCQPIDLVSSRAG